MLGTIVNAGAILAGGLVGLLLRGGLKERYQSIVMHALGLAVLFIGASSAIKGLIDPEAEAILFILCLVLGGLLGELLNIEGRLERLGDKLQARFGGSGNLSQGFVGASLLFCVGTMAVLGSLESGMRGNHAILFAKAVLDGATAVVMASTLGAGVLLSAVSVFLYQGTLTLCASYLQNILTASMYREMNIVGGILIFAIGLNMLNITKIKVGNYLPAMFLPIFYYLVVGAL